MQRTPRRWMSWALALVPGLVLVLGLASCETTRTTHPTSAGVALITTTEAVRCWALVEDGQRLGWVVLFEDPDEPARKYYSVRNLHQQELGVLDELGRAWRFQVHEREAEWIGSGTVIEGARQILELGPTAELEELPLAELRIP